MDAVVIVLYVPHSWRIPISRSVLQVPALLVILDHDM